MSEKEFEQADLVETEAVETDKGENAVEIPDMDASAEEKSAFFDQWKQRHQAYLARLQPEEVPQTEEKNAKTSTPSLFKGLKWSRERDSLNPTDEGRTLESEKKKKVKLPLTIPTMLKGTSVIIASLCLFFLSLFFISPSSKLKEIRVQGNKALSTQEVEDLSLISGKDYAVTLALHAKDYASNIQKGSPLVKSASIQYALPNIFTVKIEEYSVMAYIPKETVYLKVLSSGEVLEEPVPVEQLPEHFLLINIENRELLKKVIQQLDKIDSDIRELIQTIDVTPSKVTADLLTLTMADGNIVLVPLNEIDSKLPYYKKITEMLTIPHTIDMEVGIFRYPH